MKRIFLLSLFPICLTALAMDMIQEKPIPGQTAWSVLNVRGYSVDPQTGVVDDTEGFGAFDSIIKLFNPSCPRNFDNGGGSFDDTTRYVKDTYDIENVVYDPFMRTKEHNEYVLYLARHKKFDCCTSISVLNVIDIQDARLVHIQLCYDVLKENGSAFFKVWPGDRSGVELKEKGRYQSNRDATYYVAEIKKIFGENNVTLIDDKTIKAIKVS
ncbi:MAG: hypothetical protein ACHQVS_02720 [Candidatus Babeliales bacterium]